MERTGFDMTIEQQGTPSSGALPLTVLVQMGDHGVLGIHDTLLSIAAQNTPEFTVLIVGSPGTGSARDTLQSIVTTFGCSFSARVCLAETTGSLVTALLSLGSRPGSAGTTLPHRGYVTMIKSPDVAFGHWTRTITTVAAQHPRSVVHSITARQTFEVQSRSGLPTFTSVSRPLTPWSPEFDIAAYLHSGAGSGAVGGSESQAGSEPLTGFAMPLQLIPALCNIVADPESAPEIEREWQVVAAAALLAGVVDSGEVTHLVRCSSDDDAVGDRGTPDLGVRRARADFVRGTMARLAAEHTSSSPGTSADLLVPPEDTNAPGGRSLVRGRSFRALGGSGPWPARWWRRS